MEDNKNRRNSVATYAAGKVNLDAKKNVTPKKKFNVKKNVRTPKKFVDYVMELIKSEGVSSTRSVDF